MQLSFQSCSVEAYVDCKECNYAKKQLTEGVWWRMKRREKRKFRFLTFYFEKNLSWLPIDKSRKKMISCHHFDWRWPNEKQVRGVLQCEFFMSWILCRNKMSAVVHIPLQKEKKERTEVQEIPMYCYWILIESHWLYMINKHIYVLITGNEKDKL